MNTTQINKLDMSNLAALNWKAVELPLYTLNVSGFRAVPGFKAIVRSDNGDVLHVPKSSYTVIDNSRVVESFQKILEGIDYEVLPPMTFQDGRKCSLQVSLSGNSEFNLSNGDKFQSYLSSLWSHDGSICRLLGMPVKRIVCYNTFQYALEEVVGQARNGEKGASKVYHSKNAETKIEQANATMRDYLLSQRRFISEMEQLLSKPIDLSAVRPLVLAFEIKGQEVSTRTVNKVDAIAGLFSRGLGNKGQTRYDTFNGLTEYYTHLSSKNENKRVQANEFGLARERKAEFLEILLDDNKVEKYVETGNRLSSLKSLTV